jgi:UPF0042 nucleotide-binding protein
MKLVVVTGVSGAGKSTALRALEDLGYYAADNLPLPLVPKFLELVSARPDIDRAALGIDARGGEFLDTAPSIFAEAPQGRPRRRDPVPRRERRDPHPPLLRDATAAPALGHRHPGGHPGGARQAGGAAQSADALVDTGTLTVHVLRALDPWSATGTRGRARGDAALVRLQARHPVEADVVLDVRFLPNPFFVPQLSALSGEDEAVAHFVLDDPETKPFVEKAEELIACPSRASSARASRTRPSPSGVRGAATARWPSPRSWAGASVGRFPVSIRHRDIQRGGAP